MLVYYLGVGIAFMLFHIYIICGDWEIAKLEWTSMTWFYRFMFFGVVTILVVPLWPMYIVVMGHGIYNDL